MNSTACTFTICVTVHLDCIIEEVDCHLVGTSGNTWQDIKVLYINILKDQMQVD